MYQHFFLKKWEQQKEAVPAGAPNFWLKRVVPPVEFGLMHAILLQLTLIPLTMSKALISRLAAVPLFGGGFPFARVLNLHVQLGYTFCILMVAATALFFGFFGKLCVDHRAGEDPLDGCAKMRTEIMVTGLVIFGITVVVLVTAYIRHRIPYELFYIPHLLTLMMYLVAVLHTNDDKVREDGVQRSQTGLWFGWSIAVYACDRVYRVLSTHWSLPITSIQVIADSSAVILRVARPPGFTFQPGHYASLNIPMLGSMWHPFSIGSAPDDLDLVFLIETKGEGSWTDALRGDKFRRGLAESSLSVHLRGPFGTPLAATDSYDVALSVGLGTGMVPLLGAMQQRCRLLAAMSSETLLDTSSARKEYSMSITAHMKHWNQATRSSPGIDQGELYLKLTQLRWRLRLLRRHGVQSAYFRRRCREGSAEALHNVVRALLAVPIALEIATLGLMYSWTELRGYPTQSMATALCAMVSTCVAFYALHLMYRICVPKHFPRGIVLALDVLITMFMVLYVVLACVDNQFKDLSVRMELLGGALAIWRLVRYYGASGAWPAQSLANLVQPSIRLLKTECEHYIWVCRSADLMMGGLTTIIDMARRTELAFTRMCMPSGTLNRLFRVTLYCTDPDPGRTARLVERVKGTIIDLRIVRPNIRTIVHDLAMQQLNESLTQEYPFPLRVAVSVAGNPKFSRESYHAVMDTNAIIHAVGPGLVHCDFIPEFYDNSGGNASKVKRQ